MKKSEEKRKQSRKGLDAKYVTKCHHRPSNSRFKAAAILFAWNASAIVSITMFRD